VKSTSTGIWRRDCVSVKRFSGAPKKGRVLMRKESAVMKRMRSARDTLGGMGRMGKPWIEGAARMER
jgi:hypothetical protein